MSFYLPIMIYSRRLHVCHLQEEGLNPSGSCPWSFIVKTGNLNARVLLSIKASMPRLISEEGTHKDLDHKWTFVVLPSDKKEDGYATYRVRLTNDEKVKKQHYNSCGLTVAGMISDEDKPIILGYDPTKLNTAEPIVLQMEYESEGRLYKESLRFYFCDEANVASVALDFGSEASQAMFGKTDQNLCFVGLFEDMLGLRNPDPKKNNEYWQGTASDTLFKSVFWVRHTPKQVPHFGDRPMKTADAPLVSPLLSASEPAAIYDQLELLPNLKLVELSQGGNYINYDKGGITIPEDSDLVYGKASLADHLMRSSLLRIILSNFLHAVLSDVNSNNTERCLRIVIMAPNVYYQDKVFEMMKGLYLDFDIMKKKGLYGKCKGIEVQVVSESDAAFIGAKKYKRGTIVDATNGYFLNIDSGKGTTDFSILQQSTSFGDYNSLYRDGIPAAGNVITYAYYEALYDFMMAHGIDINPLFEVASKAALIDLMSCLEELKKRDVPGAELEYFTVPTKKDISSMADFLKYLSNNRKRTIPCVSQYVDRKLEVLVNCLKESIGNYMQMNKCVFTQVVLSGRALLYHPYKEKLVKMLLEEQWIPSEDAVVWVDGEQAKTCCLVGALEMEDVLSINYNSGLIGSPIMQKSADASEGAVSRFFSKLGKAIRAARYSGIDMDFFYGGSQSITCRNVTLRVGGRVHQIYSSDNEEKRIYFLGNSFASQTGEQPLKYIKSSDLTFDNPVYQSLVNQSLFPYYEGSVGVPLNTFFIEQNKEEMVNLAVNVQASAGKVFSKAGNNALDDADA